MTKKECPACAMDVASRSKICPICGYEFTSVSNRIKWTALLLIILFLYLAFAWLRR